MAAQTAATVGTESMASSLPASAGLRLVESAVRDVHSVRAAGEQLLDSLADAAARTPAELQQQVAGIIEAALPALQRAQQSWVQLQQGDRQQLASDQAAQLSLAVDSLLQEARTTAQQLGTTLPQQITLDRSAGAAALEQLVQRVSALTGYAAVLVAAGAVKAGQTANLTPCSAAEATQVHFELGKTMAACIALSRAGSLEAVRLSVFSADEQADGSADAWQQSQHGVFQQISALGMQALGHFQHRNRLSNLPDGLSEAEQAALQLAAAGAPLEDLLLWLASYGDLFRRRCSATGTLLAAHPATMHFMPPYVRPFRLSRSQLIDAALSGASRQAFHPHAAPLHVLQDT